MTTHTMPTVAECRAKLEALKSEVEELDPGERRDNLAGSIANMEAMLNRFEAANA